MHFGFSLSGFHFDISCAADIYHTVLDIFSLKAVKLSGTQSGENREARAFLNSLIRISKYILTDEQKQAIADYEWLTDRERYVFDEFYRRGTRIEDIAAELEVDRSTINRILKKMRAVNET